MRPTWIPFAQLYAKDLVIEHGNNVEFLSITEGLEEWFVESGFFPIPSGDDRDDFIEYVNYLCHNAEIEVKFTGGLL